jgi:hypothetical protein
MASSGRAYPAMRGNRCRAIRRSTSANSLIRWAVFLQFAALLADQAGKSASSGNPYEQAGTALGGLLGKPMLDGLVDALVRPEAVMRLMAEAKVEPKPSAPPATPVGKRDVTWTHERKGVDKLIAYASQDGKSSEERMGAVFERSGFATWKLTEVRLPLSRSR